MGIIPLLKLSSDFPSLCNNLDTVRDLVSCYLFVPISSCFPFSHSDPATLGSSLPEMYYCPRAFPLTVSLCLQRSSSTYLLVKYHHNWKVFTILLNHLHLTLFGLPLSPPPPAPECKLLERRDFTLFTVAPTGLE